MKQIGTFPTPYGVRIPVFEPADPNDPDNVTFTADGFAMIAGVFDPSDRAKFVEAARRAGGRIDISILRDMGGHVPTPKQQLAHPGDAVYPTIPADTIPIENWVDLGMDQRRWCDRADALMEIIGHNLRENLDKDRTQPAIPPDLYGLGISMMLTGVLEHLAESEIECLEAAAFYALSCHETWRSAGIAWLRPVRNSWFRQWVHARPDYRRFAGYSRQNFESLPSWICGGGE